MSVYIEPCILYLLGIFLYPKHEITAFDILFFLLPILFICLQLLTSQKVIHGILLFVICIITLLSPPILSFCPAVLYNYFYHRNYRYTLPVMCVLFYQIFAYTFWFGLFVTLLCVLSFYLAEHSRRKDVCESDLKRLRDTSVEQAIRLKEQNTQLLSNQNDQIYIATLKERNRIAREIHDNVGHMLSRSILMVGAVRAICKEEALSKMLSDLSDTLNEAMNNIRSSVHDLHDESVDLEQSMKQIVDSFEFCPITFECDISKYVPKDIKYSFLSIVKEALNNIMKHSNATKVHLLLKEHPGFFQLLIEDNGTRQNNPIPSSRGIGLSNIKERITSLGGIIHIQTEQGFRIFISVPKKN